jgi:predicted metal-binding protein
MESFVLPDAEAGPPPGGVALYVCLTCRDRPASDARPPDDAAPRAGARLHAALAAALGETPVRLVGVECLSNCNRSCTVALAGPGRWTYVYGDLDPESAVPAILDGAARYAATRDGLVPWRERPVIFRKGAIARVPPLDARSAR